MSYESTFNQDLAKSMAKIPMGEVDSFLDGELKKLKSRVLELNQARETIADGFKQILSGIKKAYPQIDLNDVNLKDTPNRLARAYLEIFQGLGTNSKEIFSTRFPTGIYDEVVMLKNITYTSLCAHHFFPFMGYAHIGYLPNQSADDSIVGLSKLARVVDCKAKRPQLQERMCTQIMSGIEEELKPRGVMVVVEGRHACLGCRGAQKPEATMVTSAISGSFKDNAMLRNEFLNLLRLKH